MQSIRLLYSQKGKLQVGNILKRSFVSKRIMQNLHLVETASSEQPYARPKKQILHEPASGNANTSVRQSSLQLPVGGFRLLLRRAVARIFSTANPYHQRAFKVVVKEGVFKVICSKQVQTKLFELSPQNFG